MRRTIPMQHPLRQLVAVVTERCFFEGLGWPDHAVIRYLVEILVDFSHIDSLYKIRNAQGRRVEDVVEMLIEGDLCHHATGLERQRQVHKHIGDYTLFMTGLFPEWIRRMKQQRALASPDALLDYVETGKRSYRIASEFSDGAHAGEVPLFRKLSEHFELCVFGLGYVRADLKRLHNPRLQRMWGTLLS
ncbi:MAG: hypothetical protein ACE5MG_02965 [Candidatus Methylomirabilales bacterium]